MSEKKHIVYGLSRGEYSDYCVLAIFDTRDKAAAYLESLAKKPNSHIQDSGKYGSSIPYREKRKVPTCNGKINGRWTDEDYFEVYCTKCKWVDWDSYQVEEFGFNPEQE